MNTNSPTATAHEPDGVSDDIARYIAEYRPAALPAEVWDTVREQASALVLAAGKPSRLRVQKDLGLIAEVLVHLGERGRPMTLEEALSDTTLLSFHNELRASTQTKKNKRGIHRRLQASHRGVPWRSERRPDGARVAKLTSHTTVALLDRAVEAAQAVAHEDPDAQGLLDAVHEARTLRAVQGPAATTVDDSAWARARRFAETHGLRLTRPVLRDLVTHEVLAVCEPVAVLIARFGLTRRDLDLALTRVAELPATPSPGDHDHLRGL